LDIIGMQRMVRQAQAYEDDILLFPNSYEPMVNLVRVVNDFNWHSNIQINPKKCDILKIRRDRDAEFTIRDQVSRESNIISSQDGTNVV
jgi:hypothetical protein